MERNNIQNSRTGVSTISGAQTNSTGSSTGNGAQAQGRELETFTASVEQGWLTQGLDEWDWSNAKRNKNYFAIVTRDEQGDYKYTWQRESDNSDEFFSLKGVKVGDVLMAGCKDTRKGRTLAKAFYYVVYMSETKIRIVRQTTYLQVIKDGEEYIRRREERKAAKAAEEAAKAATETVAEPVTETVAEQPVSRLDQMRQAFDKSLAEAGDNALNLAYALSEAIEHTSGPVTPENVEEHALWLSYRRQIESRLESLNGGAGMATPCLNGNTTGNSSNIYGNPAPGLKDGDIVQSCTGDVYVFRGFYGGCMMLEENGGGGMFTAALRNGQWSIQWANMYETLCL